MNDLNDLPRTNWHREPPAEPDAVQTLLLQSGVDLPESYIQFLKFSNGGEGELGVSPGWFALWPAEEVLELNKGFGVQKWLPNFFGFGSNGSGELLAFDTRKTRPWSIYAVPFDVLEEEAALVVADSFAVFVEAIGQTASG